MKTTRRYLRSALTSVLCPGVLFLLMTVYAAAGGSARSVLPADGDYARLQPVDGFIPQDGATVWDFSVTDNIRDAFDIRFSRATDSCLSVTMPGIRYDFTIAGDTVFRTAAETHFVRMSDTIPMEVCRASNPMLEIGPLRYASRGRAFQSEFMDACGEAYVSFFGYGTLILPHGDTICDVMLTRHHSRQDLAFAMRRRPDVCDSQDSTFSRMTRITDTYVWHSNVFRLPLAQTTVTADSVAGGIHESPHLSSWICSPIDQPTPDMSKAAPRHNVMSARKRSGSISEIDRLEISVDGNRIDIRGAAVSSGSYIMTLADITGRVFASHQTTACARGTELKWSITSLPTGRYILYVRQDDNLPAVEKITIR